MNLQTKHGELAAQIRAAYAGTPIAPMRTRLTDLDVDAAYAIQQENTAHWEKECRRVVRSKIGLTSRAVQKQLGVDRPDFGVLFADMIVGEDEPVAAGRVLQPKIEAEVAFLLDRDVDAETPTVADVVRAVAYAMLALEIVGSRVADWDIGIVDGRRQRLFGTLRAWRSRTTSGRPGPPRIPDADEAEGRSPIGGSRRSLSRQSAQRDGLPGRRKRPLGAGDVVLSGALGAMVTVKEGDAFQADIAGLGTVSAMFAS